MSVIFSIVVIIFLTNKDFSVFLIDKDKQSKSATSLFIDFTICFAVFLLVGSILRYLIYNFFLVYINLSSFIILVMFGLAAGFSYLVDFLLKKFNRANLIVFNKYQFGALVFIGLILLTQMTGTILGSVIFTLFNVLGFFIVGIILIYLPKFISPKIKLNDNIPIVLFLSSIILMATSVL